MVQWLIVSTALFSSVIAPNTPRENGACGACSEGNPVNGTACIVAQNESEGVVAEFSGLSVDGGQPNTSFSASASYCLDSSGASRGEDPLEESENVDDDELTETLYYEIAYSETEGVVLQRSTHDASSAGRSPEAMSAFYKVLIAEAHGRMPGQVVRSAPDEREIAIYMYVTHNVAGFIRELLANIQEKERECTAIELITTFLEQVKQHKVFLVMEPDSPIVFF